MVNTFHEIKLRRDILLCKKCESLNLGAIKFILLTELNPMEKVEVLSLSNEYDEERKLYVVNAKIKWKCPRCGINLEGVTKIKDIPIEIIKQMSNTCQNCGGKLTLVDEKINVSKINNFDDVITLNGYFVCDKCTNKKPFTKSLKVAFSPIFKYIDSIKKIRISDTGIEFEKE